MRKLVLFLAVLLIATIAIATTAADTDIGALNNDGTALVDLSSATVVDSGRVVNDDGTTVGTWRAYQKDRLLFICTSVVMPDEQVTASVNSDVRMGASNFGNATVFVATAKSGGRLDIAGVKERIIGRINASGAKRFRLVNDITITPRAANTTATAQVSTVDKR